MSISVYIVTYKQEHLIRETIESVLAQTMLPDEIIVSIDPSPDGTADVVQSMARQHSIIRPFPLEERHGIARNKNFALSQVTSEYVTGLDGDDRFHPEKLETEYELIKANPDVKAAYSNFMNIDENGNDIRPWYADADALPEGDILTTVLGRTFCGNDSYRNEMVEYATVKEIGFYDPSCEFYDDWDMKIRLTSKYRIACTRRILADYRRHTQAQSSSTPVLTHYTMMKCVYDKHRELIASLPVEQRTQIESDLAVRWSKLSRRIARESVADGHRVTAWKYLLEYFTKWPSTTTRKRELDLVAQAMLPRRLHAWLVNHVAGSTSAT